MSRWADRLRGFAQHNLLDDGRKIFVGLGLLSELFQNERQLAEHHRAAGMDTRIPHPEPQRFRQLDRSAFGHQ